MHLLNFSLTSPKIKQKVTRRFDSRVTFWIKEISSSKTAQTNSYR
ncbi:unnamed protein product [Acidithrix sp. C25]|nr:unnamed protein product [Acidithrix sp. C25]